jgi:hypothetical protein
MKAATSEQAIASLTDEGLFERLAASILREDEPTYRNLVHPGVNEDGRTVKSPLDGICFVPGADPPHMVAFHHTITGAKGLEAKWLHDPSTVKPRKGPKPTAPEGDVLKTAKIVAEERARRSGMRATLVLTTNQEPGESLVRAVTTASAKLGMEVDIWPRSRLAHFLDNKPTGQWLRKSYLQIEQELLSKQLLNSLSKESLQISAPRDNPAAWVSRAFDEALASALNCKVTFVVGQSGFGKTVACHRKLVDHVAQGGFALVIRDQTVADALTVEQAIAATLRQLHPSLAVISSSALSFSSPERPLFLLIEDINKAGHRQALVEKIAGWGKANSGDQALQRASYRILCPIWPEVLTLLDEQTRKGLDASIITTAGFAKSEGRDAVFARSRVTGAEISPLKAEEIAGALGNDPLLIALHDPNKPPEPHQVIRGFVEGAIGRIATTAGDYAASDYRQALRTLAGEMLAHCQIELAMTEIGTWHAVQGECVQLIKRLAHQGELMAFSGPSDAQRLVFRHDRVRDWLLADAVADLDRQARLNEEVLREPYFAEVVGAALVIGQPRANLLDRVAASNPLALFFALKGYGPMRTAERDAVLGAINKWLDDPNTRGRQNAHLRWEALAALAETDSPDIPELVRMFPDRTTNGELARLRNGDFSGGIELCAGLEPGTGAPWRDIQIEHAKLRYGSQLSKELGKYLARKDLSDASKSGALRLAGHFADASLAPFIETCWTSDDRRAEHLTDYLWALAQCCADDPIRFLKPACDLWASLPNELPNADPKMPWALSPRVQVGADHLRWAFRRWPPNAALDYFAQRGVETELKWPMTCLLRGIDHPSAVFFIVRELAETEERLEGTESFSPLAHSAADDWRRELEHEGRSVSQVSRETLRNIWIDNSRGKHLRLQAFKFWAVTKTSDDVELLRGITDAGSLADRILFHRLHIGDVQAIPELIEKLSAAGDRSYWWQCGRVIWSPELTEALDEHLERRRSEKPWTWGESSQSDWIVAELIMGQSDRESERLLLKHWDHLQSSSVFVQAALHAATPRLKEAAAASIKACPVPSDLFKYISQHYGIRTTGRSGITRREQMVTLSPYMDLMGSVDISALWDVCNKQGWFDLRRDLLDARISPALNKWQSDDAATTLDEFAEKHPYSVSYWIDQRIEADVSWVEILSALKTWFDERKSFKALRVVTTALEHKGTRQDLSVLRTYEAMPQEESQQLIADVEFAVRRRSIV